MPEPAELPERLPAALDVLYVIFSEGHAAHEGEERMRSELCAEALRLVRLLGATFPEDGEVGGLACLMELHRAREGGRVDPSGGVVLLEHQDRGRWDRVAIERTCRELDRLAASNDAGPFLLQAAIAACHARSSRFEDTYWRGIVKLYDRLLGAFPSPVVPLSRAIAVGMLEGPETALPLVTALGEDPRLRHTSSLVAARADLLRRLERWEEAAVAYMEARARTRNEPEKRLFEARRKECASLASG